MTAIDRRYDFLLLFDVTAGNPNGDFGGLIASGISDVGCWISAVASPGLIFGPITGLLLSGCQPGVLAAGSLQATPGSQPHVAVGDLFAGDKRAERCLERLIP